MNTTSSNNVEKDFGMIVKKALSITSSILIWAVIFYALNEIISLIEKEIFGQDFSSDLWYGRAINALVLSIALHIIDFMRRK
jgi:hypothetical protein